MSFARYMGKHIGKNIAKNLSSKYSQKLIDHAADELKSASKRAIGRKQQRQMVIWFAIKMLTELKKVSKTSPQNNSETHEEEIHRERYLSPKKTQ